MRSPRNHAVQLSHHSITCMLAMITSMHLPGKLFHLERSRLPGPFVARVSCLMMAMCCQEVSLPRLKCALALVAAVTEQSMAEKKWHASAENCRMVNSQKGNVSHASMSGNTSRTKQTNCAVIHQARPSHKSENLYVISFHQAGATIVTNDLCR